MNDKHNIIPKLSNKNIVKIELGCGQSKYKDEYIGIDLRDYKCVDIVGDAFEVLSHFPDQSVDKIFTRHFLEHVKDIGLIINEFSRILKSNGNIRIIVPHFANPYFYSDYTHISSFGLYSFCYLAKDYCGFKRQVPLYKKEIFLHLISVKMIFMTNPNTLIYGKILKLLTMIVNTNNAIKEFYEERLCYLIPPYELIFDLTKPL